jgi:hypothetical protein
LDDEIVSKRGWPAGVKRMNEDDNERDDEIKGIHKDGQMATRMTMA